MKILIIGVSGFIGSYLFKNLSLNHDVFGISRTNINLEKCFSIDMNNISELESFFKKHNFEVIINLASKMANIDNIKDFSLIEDNFLMAKNLISVLKDKKSCYFINFSSSAVYPNISGSFDEKSIIDTSVNPDCLYGLSKFNNEMLFNYFLKNFRTVNLRIGYVYGENMDKSRIHEIFKNELREKNKITIWGNGERTFPQLSLSYLNSILLNLIKSQQLGTYNIAEENISLFKLAERYIKKNGNNKSEIIILNKIKNNFNFEMKIDKKIKL